MIQTQVQLLGIVVSFGTQLKIKEKKPAISVEESKALAQEDVDRYMEKVAAKDDGGEEDDGILDQDAVNEMERPTICSVCGGMAKPAHTCQLCGATVCDADFRPEKGICSKCAAGKMMK